MLKKTLTALVLVACSTAALAAAEPKQLVLEFVDLAFHKHQVREAFERYAAPGYIQHNPGAADGAAAAVSFLEDFHKKFPQTSYDIQRVAAEGDLVFLHVHGRLTPEDPGVAVVDIFRVDKGRIVEHWDVIQPVPAQAANPHPMF